MEGQIHVEAVGPGDLFFLLALVDEALDGLEGELGCDFPGVVAAHSVADDVEADGIVDIEAVFVQFAPASDVRLAVTL
jgi:hypothetical protein